MVGNSEWTTSQIRRSRLARHAKSIHTIHYGLDIEEYKPVDKLCARRALGIPDDRFVVGFACSDFSEERKGAGLLLEALKDSIGTENSPADLRREGSGPRPVEIETMQLGTLNTSATPMLVLFSVGRVRHAKPGRNLRERSAGGDGV